jgi:hypothetical protein
MSIEMKDYGFYAGKKVDDIFKTAIVLAEEKAKN